jgi:NAD(P)-dependent dehydrogenase (short-subunit alcohol dehydrogenase family)
MLALEYGTAGIRAINIDPGLVTTERVLDTGASLQWVARSGVAPAVIGTSVLRLLTDQAIENGAYIHAQQYLAEHLGEVAYQALLLASQTVSNGQSS